MGPWFHDRGDMTQRRPEGTGKTAQKMALCRARWIPLLVSVLGLHVVLAAPFTSGNVIALRLSGSPSLSAAAANISIDEIAPGGGAIVQALSVAGCTLPGDSPFAGRLTRGLTGDIAALACINAPAGTLAVANATAGS